MKKFKKAILQAGRTYHSPDGELVVTPERLKHWATSFRRMSDSGIGIPVSWDHADEADESKPVKLPPGGSRKRPAEGTVGYLDSFKVIDGGKRAEITLDVRGQDNIDKVDNNLAYVSPVVFETWPDGDGVIHKDCITHVDLVQHPVDHHQTPFESAGETIACALRLGLDTGKPLVYRLQAEGEESSDSDFTAPESEDSAEDESEEDDDSTTNDDERLSRIKEALATQSIVLSDDTNENNFLEHLEQALLTAAAMSSEGDQGMGTEGLEAATPEFASFSLESKRYQAYADKQHQNNVVQRLGVLLEGGRCTPAEFKAKQAAVKVVRLSLDDKGEHAPTTVEAWIESREAVPKGTFWDSEARTRLSQMEAAEHPSDLQTHGDAVDDGEADDIVAEINKR